MEHPILDCIQECEEFIQNVKNEKIREEALKELDDVREKVLSLLKEKLV